MASSRLASKRYHVPYVAALVEWHDWGQEGVGPKSSRDAHLGSPQEGVDAVLLCHCQGGRLSGRLDRMA